MKQETISKAKAAQLFAENAVLFGRADGVPEQAATELFGFAAYTARPLARLTLWSVLEQIGTIEARERDSAPMVARFKECKAGAIYIKNEKLERR